MSMQTNKYPDPDRSQFAPNQHRDDPFLPESDIGFVTDVLTDGRPYRLVSWYQDGYTFVTFFFSSLGIENANSKQIMDLLNPILVESVPKNYRKLKKSGLVKIIDDAGNEMYSITFVVGEPD